MGALCALQLRAAGMDVVLFDDGKHAPPASWAGGGILSPLFPWRHSDAVNRLCRDAFAGYRQLADDIIRAGGDDPQLDQPGMLVVGEPDVAQAFAWSQRNGRHVETVSHRGQSYLWMPDVGAIRNSRLMKGLRTLLQARGVELYTQHVGAVHGSAAGVALQLSDGTVQRADRVVITAGWRSGQLLGETPLASMFFPAKGQMLLLKAQPGDVTNILLADGGYLVPRRDGLVLLGSTLEPGRDDLQVTDQARSTLLEAGMKLLPSVRDWPVVGHWAGVRPGCRRDEPVIGPLSPGSNVWVCSGHYRNGLTAAPASARLLAALMTGQSPEVDPQPYSVPSSFSSPASSESF